MALLLPVRLNSTSSIGSEDQSMAYSEYTRPGLKVQAEQVEEQRSVITPNGGVTAEPGDWELRYEDGNVRKMTDEEFQEEFGDKGKDKERKDLAADDDADRDDETESEDAVDNGDSSDKSPAEDRPGKDAESEGVTRRPAPPPPTRRR